MENVKFFTLGATDFKEWNALYKGYFVYLTTEATINTKKYPAGLYFGGESAWEYLTNDSDIAAIEKKISDAIKALDVTTNVQSVEYTAATSTSGAKLTFKGVNETDGKIAQGSGTTELQLAKVATSGSYSDLSDKIEFDKTYNSSSNKAATVKTVTDAIEALDVTSNTSDADKGITITVTETNGKVNKPSVSVTTATVSDALVVTENTGNILGSSSISNIKNYIDASVASASNYLGTITKKSSLSTSAKKGDFYRVSSATATDWSGVTVHVGDIIIAEKDSPTASVDGTNWTLLHNELNTDTSVTSVSNHYTPSANENSKLTASASGATASWSIDVVKGVTLNRDAAGHVTGISVTSGKIPANPNTDHTSSVSSGDTTGATTGNKVTISSSTSGNNTAYTVTSETIWLSSLPTVS